MRITNSTIMRGFDRNLNRTGKLKNDSMSRIMGNRSFFRASENPLDAVKALNVRKSLYYTAQYTDNLKVADKFYTEAETSLLAVSEKLQTVRETLVAACNSGIKSNEEYNIYAQQLETFAEQMCQILNTDTAGRAIFGGSSDDGQPFVIQYDANGVPTTVTYHNTPVNAFDDYRSFPYSSEVLADIGLGLAVNQQSHYIDPQTGLKISFNGPEVTGCGTDGGTADIDMSSVLQGKEYSLDVYCNNIKKTIIFKGGADGTETAKNIQDALNKEFRKSKLTFTVNEQGVITNGEGNNVSLINSKDAQNTLSFDNNYGYSNRFKFNLDKLTEGQEYTVKVTVGEESQNITFTAGADEAENAEIIQQALDDAFGTTEIKDETGAVVKTVSNVNLLDDGSVTCEGKNVKLSETTREDGVETPAFERQKSFSNNYIQLTLDAAKALRNGDIDYANACVDRIVKSNENLLVEIANLGCNEDFISFSLDRMVTRDYNLEERQDELEACDLEAETTRLKTYTAMYNACLQLASEVVPQSIFNFMR